MEKLYGKFLHALIVNLLLLASLFASSVTAEQKPVVETGEASFYTDSLDGRKTASGEPYRKDALTAAHRSLPFGTKVTITYPKTGKSVDVVINDRGPYAKGRIVDLSRAAATKLGMINDGHGEVKLEVR